MNESIAMIARVAEHLGPLSKDVVFVGGTVVRLLVTDPSITEFRTTDDVDIIVEITSRGVFSDFEDRLRESGFRKKMQKTPKREIKLAEARRTEWLKRRQ